METYRNFFSGQEVRQRGRAGALMSFPCGKPSLVGAGSKQVTVGSGLLVGVYIGLDLGGGTLIVADRDLLGVVPQIVTFSSPTPGWVWVGAKYETGLYCLNSNLFSTVVYLPD